MNFRAALANGDRKIHSHQNWMNAKQNKYVEKEEDGEKKNAEKTRIIFKFSSVQTMKIAAPIIIRTLLIKCIELNTTKMYDFK